MKNLNKISALVALLIPGVAGAAVTNVDSLATRLINLGNLVVYVLITFAVIYLIFGVVIYFIAGGDDGKTKGTGIIWRSVIGLVVIFSIWGLVALAVSVLDLGKGSELGNKTPKTTDYIGVTPKVD